MTKKGGMGEERLGKAPRVSLRFPSAASNTLTCMGQAGPTGHTRALALLVLLCASSTFSTNICIRKG